MRNSNLISNFDHQGVLWSHIDSLLDYQANKVYVESNFGSGSYSSQILQKLPGSSKLIAFDCDKNVTVYASLLSNYFNFEFIHDNFINLKSQLEKRNIHKICCLIADLGFSNVQLRAKARGFSYASEGFLDMRYDHTTKLTAADIISKYSQPQLTNMFYVNAEEPLAKKLAHALVVKRCDQVIKTSFQLNQIVCEVVTNKKFEWKTLKRVYQALRIEVNQELINLKSLLKVATELLEVNGKLIVISFHSLEDRIVKTFFSQLVQPDLNYYLNYAQKTPVINFMLLNKKPLVASPAEIAVNPLAKSAKLRAIQRISF